MRPAPLSVPTRLLGIVGSLQVESTNLALLRGLAREMATVTSIEIWPSVGDLPHFNPDLGDDAPETVTAFRAAVASSAGLVISTPEYAFGVPGSLKNALDWLVGSGELYGKPVAVITASTSGGEKARRHLADTLAAQGAVLAGAVGISGLRKMLGPDGSIQDVPTALKLSAVMEDLLRAIRDSNRSAG